MPATPLPDQVDTVEQNLSTKLDMEDSGSGSQAKHQQLLNSNKAKLGQISEEDEETFFVHKQDKQCRLEMGSEKEETHICLMKKAQSRKQKLCRKLKNLVSNFLVSTSVFFIFLLINFLTNGKLMNIGIDEYQQGNTVSSSYEKSSQPQSTKIIASNNTKIRPTSFKDVESAELGIGTHMYLDTVCLKEKGTTLMFKHIDSDLEGFKRDSVQYNNGYFIIKTSGYYFAHGLLTVRPANDTEAVKFHYCLNIANSRSICRRRKEQAGWIGTVDIVESRLYLRKDDKITVTVSDISYVYDRVYDTTFSVRLLQLHEK